MTVEQFTVSESQCSGRGDAAGLHVEELGARQREPDIEESLREIIHVKHLPKRILQER